LPCTPPERLWKFYSLVNALVKQSNTHYDHLMAFTELDPEITIKLLEGRTDLLAPEAAEREKFYQRQSCPECGGNALKKTGDGRFLFRDGENLPRYQLLCDNCSCLFDPFTGIQLTMGNRAKAFEPAVPLLDGPED
jgi:hypothetical protein